MIEETRFKCFNLNVRSKMCFSQRLKLCVYTFYIFSYIDNLRPNLLTLILTFHLANMQMIIKEEMFFAYFVKHFQQDAFFLQGLSTVFITLTHFCT